MRAIRRFTVRVTLPQPLAPLQDLMLNLRWSWHQPTVELLSSIDPAAWAAAGVTRWRCSARCARASSASWRLTRTSCGGCTASWTTCAPTRPSRAGTSRARRPAPLAALPAAIAYFSPEYGITEVLPQYSGGLGILAGDHLKSASDLGVPLIGVGLLYRHGYFTQSLSADGWQAERYPADDPNGLPLTLLRWLTETARSRSR